MPLQFFRISNISKASLSKKWRVDEQSTQSDSSIDTDEFSSTDEVEPDNVESKLVESDTSKPTGNKLPVEICQKEKEDVEPENKCKDFDLPSDVCKAKYVLVNRDPEIQTARLALPVVGEEARIMEKINENDAVVICGATGSGKTTQVPQFLYESGYTRLVIFVTYLLSLI